MDCKFFVYLWGCIFVDASVFSIRKLTLLEFVFIEDVNSWEKATNEYYEN